MESSFVKWLTNRIPTDRRVAIGIGDDSAVLADFEGRLIVTSDLLADGVHFDTAQHDLRLIGRKALAVNLSDLAAMAAKPLATTISVLLPQDGGLETAKEIYEGLIPLADEFDIAIAGGDTNTWQGKLVVSVTALATCAANPLCRDGAKPGDLILVTGELGGSILGRHFTFQPRVGEALQISEQYDIRAACDISDGLLLDLSRVLVASNCGAELTLGSIPISDAAVQLAKTTQRAAIDHALSDGEDFELLLIASKAEAKRIIRDDAVGVPVRVVGRVISKPGLWGVGADGERRQLAADGYQH